MCAWNKAGIVFIYSDILDPSFAFLLIIRCTSFSYVDLSFWLILLISFLKNIFENLFWHVIDSEFPVF